MADEKPTISSYTPTTEEAKELSFVYERWQKMKSARSDYENDWKLDDQQFEMIGPRRTIDEWKADLKLPDTTSAILSALSEMVDQTPGINYIPRESNDAQRAAKFNAAFKYTWEKGQGNNELMDHLLQSCIYGTAIGKEYYRHEVGEIKEVDTWEQDDEGNELPVPKTWKKSARVIYDDVYFKSIHIRNFWVDEKATMIENAVDCLELELMDKDTFHQRFDDNYKNAKLVNCGAPIEYDWYKKTVPDNVIEVAYYWNCRRDMFSICANGVLLTPADNPNPYKHKELPYVASVYTPKPRSFYGIGLPKLVRSLQEEKDTVRNMRLDASKLNINQIVLVDDKVELDDDDLRSEPNKVVKGPPGSIQYVGGAAPNPSAYREEELLRDDIVRATGVDPRLQVSGSEGNTATEIAILKEASLKRIRFTLRLLEWTTLYRLGRLRLANIMQFYSMPKIDHVIGEDGTISPVETYPSVKMKTPEGEKFVPFDSTDLKGEYDIIVAAGSTLPISQALESQKRINLFDRLKGHPDVNQRELAKQLIEAHQVDSGPLMAQQGEPPMGASPVRPEGMGVSPMPGNGSPGAMMGAAMGGNPPPAPAPVPSAQPVPTESPNTNM